MKKFEDKKWMKVGVFDMENVDTDIIIPSDYLKVTNKIGLGDYLFDSLRFKDKGYLGKKVSERTKNDDFFLNKKVYENSKVLITGKNFGSGSSREHAPWAILDYGFEVVIAPSFADIFYENSFKNGLLLIKLSDNEVRELMNIFNEENDKKILVDLENQKVVVDNKEYFFEINQNKKRSLLLGLDEAGLMLKNYKNDILKFEKEQKEKYPFLSIEK